jgi:ATP-dependent Lon protease
MSKKDKIKNIDMDDLKALPDVLDGRHHVIPIVTGGDEVLEEVNVPEILPILTLRSSVLFPGAITPITVGREKSIRLVREVNERNGLLGAVLQRESEVEDPAPDDMYKVGTAARIIKILEMPNGNLTVILNGLEKIEVKEYVSTEPYFQASVTPLRDSSPDVKSLEFEALVDSIRDIALGIIAISPDMPKEAAFAIKNIDSKRGIINFICSNLELSDEDRQSLLESPGLLARARKLLEILVREQQLVELKNEIQSRVKQEIDKQQRDYYLQQQMRTIQDELGEGADSELEGLREKASKKNWPKEVAELFEKEITKLERLNPAVAEYSVQVTYLQLMLELPWNDVTQDNLDLKCAREQLDHDHFGLDEVKERLLEHLAVIKLKGDLKSPILCLYGPPGVGKTSLGKSVAAALGGLSFGPLCPGAAACAMVDAALCCRGQEKPALAFAAFTGAALCAADPADGRDLRDRGCAAVCTARSAAGQPRLHRRQCTGRVHNDFAGLRVSRAARRVVFAAGHGKPAGLSDCAGCRHPDHGPAAGHAEKAAEALIFALLFVFFSNLIQIVFT